MIWVKHIHQEAFITKKFLYSKGGFSLNIWSHFWIMGWFLAHFIFYQYLVDWTHNIIYLGFFPCPTLMIIHSPLSWCVLKPQVLPNWSDSSHHSPRFPCWILHYPQVINVSSEGEQNLLWIYPYLGHQIKCGGVVWIPLEVKLNHILHERFIWGITFS